MRLLLVEDSLIIALDAEDILTRLGAASVSTAASVIPALELISSSRPDVAMLDINLGDRNSFAVADTLAYGVKITGATVHLVDDGVDTGPVLAQAAVEVRAGDTADELHERIKIEERRLLVGTVAALALKGATVTGREVSIP